MVNALLIIMLKFCSVLHITYTKYKEGTYFSHKGLPFIYNDFGGNKRDLLACVGKTGFIEVS